MARTPVTIHVERDALAAIDSAAAASGVKRSRWITDTLDHVLTGNLLPVDQVMLDQLLKVRAQQEMLLEAFIDLSIPDDEGRHRRKEAVRARAKSLFERYCALAEQRLKT